MNKMFAIREQKFAHDNPLAIMGEEGDPPIPHHLFPGGGHPPTHVCVKVGRYTLWYAALRCRI